MEECVNPASTRLEGDTMDPRPTGNEPEDVPAVAAARPDPAGTGAKIEDTTSEGQQRHDDHERTTTAQLPAPLVPSEGE